MLRRMKDMPTSRIGFEAIGEVEDDDWEETVEPVLRHERADGQKIRLLYSCGAEARDVEERLSDSRYRVSRRPRPSFERVAVVTDEDWMRPAVRALSALLPGKAKSLPSPPPRRRESVARRSARPLASHEISRQETRRQSPLPRTPRGAHQPGRRSLWTSSRSSKRKR